ncbi:hypothetical protein [Nonomuraea sp. NPDC052265]|uniref:hypothetical protein n=1 Tax=Nonomuraea sp. NPDC052265 TaxID=3364374 RepID=UPI0037CC1BE2
MNVLLVQPPIWSPDGHANFDAIEELAGREPVRGDVLLLPEPAGSSLSRALDVGVVDGDMTGGAARQAARPPNTSSPAPLSPQVDNGERLGDGP